MPFFLFVFWLTAAIVSYHLDAEFMCGWSAGLAMWWFTEITSEWFAEWWLNR